MDALPFLTTEVAPVDAKFRSVPEDFVVDEIPAYEASGQGDHVFCLLEKRGLTTRTAVRRVCEAVGADHNQTGTAGLKDRNAVTRQWISVFGVDVERLAGLALEGVTILEARRHETKLRTGHLRGNRFRIRLREIDSAGIQRAREVLHEIESVGLPNFYGEQRFGRQGDNAERAALWVTGARRPPRQAFSRRLEISALQSSLFNRYVAARVARGDLGQVGPGDVAKRHDSGGVFVVGTSAEELREARSRAEQREISATGPMFGAKMRWPDPPSRNEEEALLEAADLTPEHFVRWKRLAPGTRRLVRVFVDPIFTTVSDDTLELDFTLPAGSYATILVREIRKRDALSPDPG
ncbi:MAG: tRNA pseudouridine(13) synthase TruD [Myxococcota bacterium]